MLTDKPGRRETQVRKDVIKGGGGVLFFVQSSRVALSQEAVHRIPSEDRDLERKAVPTSLC